MLSIAGFVTVAAIIYLIMSPRAKVTPYVAMVLVPVAAAILIGFTPHDVGAMAVSGLGNIAQISLLLLFSMLFFGVMLDTGLFDRLFAAILGFVKGDPLRLLLATALLAILLPVSGDGAITYVIVVTAMRPLHRQLGINPLMLPTLVLLGAGVITNTPWSPPTARVISVLHLDPAHFLAPLLPSMAAGALLIVGAATVFGRRERRRLGVLGPIVAETSALIDDQGAAAGTSSTRRPHLIWFNVALTILLLGSLVAHVAPQSVLFMVALAIALLVNYPSLEEQKARVVDHAGNILYIVSIIFAAGVFSGVLTGTKMADAMAHTLIGLIPVQLGPHLAIITALISAPVLFLMSIDAYMFGVVPVVAKTAAAFGVSPVEIGRAAIMGHPVNVLSPFVPNVFLLVGLAGVTLGELQRFAIGWTVLAFALMTGVAVATGALGL